MKKTILFICNGNIHRSVIAEKYLSGVLRQKGLDKKFTVTSYGLQGTKGTAKPLHKNLKEYLKEYKVALPMLHKFRIDVTDHVFQKITPIAVKKATVIIAMDKKVYLNSKNSLLKQFPKAKNKIHTFSEITKNHQDIKDPAGSGSAKVHGAVIKNICFTIKKNLKTILSWTDIE